MTYKEFIQNIIDTRGQWNIPEGEYFELHHIVPICMGGDGDYKNNLFKKRSHHLNCIWLYPNEHFEAHRLLYLENSNNHSLQSTFFLMCGKRVYVENKLSEYQQEYVDCKLKLSQYFKEHPTVKNKVSVTNDITRERKMLNIEDADYFLINNVEWRLGGPKHTDDELQKMSKANSGSKNGMYGKKHSEETIKKFKEKRSNIHWYTNGKINKMGKTCPDGFYIGRCGDFNKGKKNGMYGKTTKRAIKVKCIETEEVFDSIAKATNYLKGWITHESWGKEVLKVKCKNKNKIYSLIRLL